MVKDLFAFFKDVYQNRRILLQFSRNDFRAKYAGSLLGIFWAFVNPLVTVIVYWFVFERGLKADLTDGKVPFICYLLTGIIAWFFFSDVLTTATNCFREYSYLVKKVVFNIKILPSVKLMSNLFTHLFFIAITFMITAGYGYFPSVKSLQLIYYLICMVAFLTGLTLITASIQPFFADITQFIGMIMQILMWVSPVLWSDSQFSAGIIRFLKLNPLFYVIQGYRDAYLGGAWFWEHWVQSIYFWAISLILLLVGTMVYKRLSPHFSDVL